MTFCSKQIQVSRLLFQLRPRADPHLDAASLHLALDTVVSAAQEEQPKDLITVSVGLLRPRKPIIPSLTLLNSPRHYELAATLLTYALCLSNQSATLIASLGSYEISSSVSTTAIKVHDETVNVAAELLCRASGVLVHLAEIVIPRWETAVGEGAKGRPVELGRDVVTALSK